MKKYAFGMLGIFLFSFTAMANPVVSTTKGVTYNVVEVNEEKFVLEIPVTGYSKNSLTVSSKNTALMVTAKPITSTNKVVYKGFVPKEFLHVFSLKKNTTITKLSMDSGVLSIELSLPLPDDQKTKNYIIE